MALLEARGFTADHFRTYHPGGQLGANLTHVAEADRLRVNRRANPCGWLDVAIAPGAMRALRGRAGVRCTPLNDGRLRVGPVDVVVERLDANG